MIRVRPDRILPLELWDLRVDDGILWDHMSSPKFGRVLRGALTEVWEGLGTTRSEGPVPERAKQFNSLYLAGGGAMAVLEELKRGPWQAVYCSGENEFSGEAGGFHILQKHHWQGWVLDLGQSALKLSANGRRWKWPRDFGLLPIRSGTTPPEALQRMELRRFLTNAMREIRGLMADPPDAIVVALPSRLDDAGVPEGSSYIGMAGDALLLPDVVAAAGLGDTGILVLNDAELAAISARLAAPVQAGTLVLTLGFGVGAALLL